MCRVGFTGYDAPRVIFPSGVAKPRMLCILASMDQKDCYDMVPMVQTAETVESPQLQSFQVVDTSFVAQRQFLVVQTGSSDHRHCTVAVHGYRRPYCAGRAGSFSPSWRSGSSYGPDCSSDLLLHQLQYTMADNTCPLWRRHSLHGPYCCLTMDIPQLQYTMADVPVVQVEQVHFSVVVQRQSPWSKLFV